MPINLKDLAAGGFFIAIGLLFGTVAWTSLQIGEALNMGPGYFPIVLSSALILLGGVIVTRGIVAGRNNPFGIIPWRAGLMISLAIIFFAVSFRELGMFASVFFTAVIACLSSRELKAPAIVTTSLGIAIFCTLVFAYGIDLPFPVVGPFFQGWL